MREHAAKDSAANQKPRKDPAVKSPAAKNPASLDPLAHGHGTADHAVNAQKPDRDAADDHRTEDHTTENLMKVLQKATTEEQLDRYIAEPGQTDRRTFSEYFSACLRERSISPGELIRRCDIDRTYCYQILNGMRKPGRDKVIMLSLACGMSLHEAKRGLELAGLAPLYPKNRRDAILIFAFDNHLSEMEAQELLDRFGEKILQ